MLDSHWSTFDRESVEDLVTGDKNLVTRSSADLLAVTPSVILATPDPGNCNYERDARPTVAPLLH